MSLFGEVILRSALQSEPTATLALDHILNAYDDARAAFLGVPAEAGIRFECGGIYSELEIADGVRPDLTIKDGDGKIRVLVENKFWAGLTEAQPVTYLRGLPDEPDGLPSALLFIVPEQRVPGVWGELRRRCIDSDLHPADEGKNGVVQWMRFGDNRYLLIASWRSILNRLRQDADDDLASDIQQLRGLTDRMDQEAFLPLRAEEVTDAELARRLINYSDLVEPIVNRLVRDGIADKKGLLPTHGYYTAGRYLKVHGLELWMGVRLGEWHDSGGITPLWCMTAWRLGERWQEVHDLFDDARTDRDERYVYIPIRLKIGVERDQVINHAVDQMKIIADKLREFASRD